MASEEDLRVALRVLRAGVPGQHPSIDDDTIELWATTFVSFPVDVLLEAAREWVEEHPEFPAMTEFMSLVQRIAREHARARQQRELPMGWIADEDGYTRCAECGGTDFVEVPNPKFPSKLFVRPCSVCCEAEYDLWAGGHRDPGHDRASCKLERCHKAARGRR